MNEQFLEFELRLLILQYGRQKVLHTLARLGEQTPEELEQQLRTAEGKRRAKRPKPLAIDVAASECRERPDIAEPLRALAVSFQNRTFLPQLRDVRRFLDRTGVAHGKLKSREAAAPVLVRALAKLTREDLLQLAAQSNPTGESDYSLLARAIMGTQGTKPRDVGEPGEKPIKS